MKLPDWIRDTRFRQKLNQLMIPLCLQSLMLSSVAACDAIMLGRLSQNAMAAVSLATQIQFVQNMILSAITGALQILGAQYWGRNDRETINDLFCLSLRLSGLVSSVFCLLCLLLPQPLMAIFTNDPELMRIGAGYLRIAGWSYLLTGVTECYLTTMKVTGHAARSSWISSGAVVMNIVFNAVLIFGLLGAPAMGVRGAALATLLSRVIELGWAVVSSYQKSFIRPELRLLLRLRSRVAGDFRTCALPLAGAGLFWGVGFTSYTAIIGHLGADAAAANAVAAVIRDLTCCLCNGLAGAGGIMVGNELGAGRLDLGKEYGIRMAKIAFACGFSVTALVLILIAPLLRFIILTDRARSLFIGMMIIMAFYMIGRCVNTIIINGVFAAGGDTLFDMYSLAVCMWGIAIPLALLGAFVFHWPVLMVYACTCVDEVGKIPWVMIHFRKYKWVKNLTR